MTESLLFSRKKCIFSEEKKWYDFEMAKLKQLRDHYRFAGFVPSTRIRGLFGDPVAVVIRLERRQKKRRVVFAVMSLSPTTINDLERSAISPRGISVSTYRFLYGGYFARGVMP